MHEIDDVVWQHDGHSTEAASLLVSASASRGLVAQLPLERGSVELLAGQAD